MVQRICEVKTHLRFDSEIKKNHIISSNNGQNYINGPSMKEK